MTVKDFVEYKEHYISQSQILYIPTDLADNTDKSIELFGHPVKMVKETDKKLKGVKKYTDIKFYTEHKVKYNKHTGQYELLDDLI